MQINWSYAMYFLWHTLNIPRRFKNTWIQMRQTKSFVKLERERMWKKVIKTNATEQTYIHIHIAQRIVERFEHRSIYTITLTYTHNVYYNIVLATPLCIRVCHIYKQTHSRTNTNQMRRNFSWNYANVYHHLCVISCINRHTQHSM